MQQIIINVEEKSKALWLAEFLRNLNFVKSIETIFNAPFSSRPKTAEKKTIDILVESLRGSLKNTSVNSRSFRQYREVEKKLER